MTDLQKQGAKQNWRPVTLLNIDYKIATKAISNRMKNSLPKLISSDQTGFMKGRYIGENVRIIFDTFEHLNRNKQPGLLFFADFEKAFDSINHKYMFESLKKMNFGIDFIQWIKTFYTDINSIIVNNGNFSE